MMSNMKRHVIIGNSHAAISAVQAIRSVSGTDDVILISREDCLAYSPALTTYYLSGRIPYEGMFFCQEEFYKANRVRTILGKQVVKVNAGAHTVALEDGTSLSYDDLLVATGSVSSVPPVPGMQLPNVLTLWTASDARRISDATAGASTVAVIGGGLIGIQSVNAMMARGKKVFLVEMLEQVMPQALDSEGARIVQERMAERGVGLHLGDRLVSIEARGGGLVVSLASGQRVQAEVAIVATGVRPNTALLEASGARIATGVIVNEYCETTAPSVYAAGDVAEGVDGVTGQLRINATLLNAVEQGRVAGLNMAGMRVPCLRTVQVNAFTPLGLPCASAGLVNATDGRQREFVRRSGKGYGKLVVEEDRIVGMVLVGDVDSAGILASAIERREPCSDILKAWESNRVSLPSLEVLAAMARK